MIPSTEAQATLSGEGRFCPICGQIRFSPFSCGAIMQAHVRNLPCGCRGAASFFGLCLEDGRQGQRFPLPTLTSYEGEALLSAYLPWLCVQDLAGARVCLTGDPCSGCPETLACGPICPFVRPECRFPDPRPLFPPRRSPGGSTFY